MTKNIGIMLAVSAGILGLYLMLAVAATRAGEDMQIWECW